MLSTAHHTHAHAHAHTRTHTHTHTHAHTHTQNTHTNSPLSVDKSDWEVAVVWVVRPSVAQGPRDHKVLEMQGFGVSASGMNHKLMGGSH